MKMNEYQQLAMRTAANDSKPHFDLMHAALGLSGEAGEFCDAVKKAVIYKRPLDIKNLAEEVGDVLWYCALAAYALGITLDEIATDNIDKLRQRYPEKFTSELSEARLDKHGA